MPAGRSDLATALGPARAGAAAAVVGLILGRILVALRPYVYAGIGLTAMAPELDEEQLDLPPLPHR